MYLCILLCRTASQREAWLLKFNNDNKRHKSIHTMRIKLLLMGLATNIDSISSDIGDVSYDL